MILATPKTKDYIEKRENGYWMQETWISLDSVVCSFLNGKSPETITQNFPLLSLEQVYGAIAFYLANQETIDAYLVEGQIEFQQMQQSLRQNNPLLYQKLKVAQSQKIQWAKFKLDFKPMLISNKRSHLKEENLWKAIASNASIFLFKKLLPRSFQNK